MSSTTYRRLTGAVGLACTLMLSGCGETTTTTDPDPTQYATLNLLADVSGTGIAQLTVVVTAGDIASALVFNIPVSQGIGAGELTVPAGSDRTFHISATDTKGIETHRGETTIDIEAGVNATLVVNLFPLTGIVPVEVHMGSIIVTVAPNHLTMDVGDVFQFSAQVTTSDSSAYPGSLHWASTSPSVASVDSTGTVTAWSAGVTAIVATAGNSSGAAYLKVTADSSGAGGPPHIVVIPFGDTLQVGDTLRLYAHVIDSIGDTLAVAVTWNSVDTSVAVVDSTGLVTALGNGNTVIEASALGATGLAYINVGGPTPDLARVIVTPYGDTLSVGDTRQLTATVYDSVGNVASVPVTWRSADSSVAHVDSTGLVTALAPGEAFIGAAALGAVGQSYIKVYDTTAVPAQIIVTPFGDTLQVGGTRQLYATVIDSLGDTVAVAVTWASTDTSVAVVDSTGIVTALMPGNTMITASAFGATGMSYINVAAPNSGAAYLEVHPFGDTLQVGDTRQLVALVIDSLGDTVNVAITWWSPDTTVAIVDSTGLVTAVGPGGVAISATALGAIGQSYIAVVAAKMTVGSALRRPEAVAQGSLRRENELRWGRSTRSSP